MAIYKKNTKCRFSVRKKKDLINIILPIFEKYPMLSNKAFQFFRFKTVLLANLIYFEQMQHYLESTDYLRMLLMFSDIQANVLESLKNEKTVPNYFKHWLVGFIEAEACFSIYPLRPTKEATYYVASFEIGQNNAEPLLKAIQNFLNLRTKISKKKKSHFYQLKVTSIQCISNVVFFLEYDSTSPLLGYKKQQYVLWRAKLKRIPRYCHI